MPSQNMINTRPGGGNKIVTKPQPLPGRRVPPGVRGDIGNTIGNARNSIFPKGGNPIVGNVVDGSGGGGRSSSSAFNPLGRAQVPLGARSAMMSALPQVQNLPAPAPLQTQPLPAPAPIPLPISPPMQSQPLPAPASIPSSNPMQSINGGGLQAPGIQDFFRQMMQRNPQFLQGLFGNMGGGMGGGFGNMMV